MKIQNFSDLEVWRKGHELFIQIYTITKHFPNSELFGFTSQLRRAALSITFNIAEGFGRSSKKEKVQFYYISHGSLLELQNQILAAKDVALINEAEFDQLWKLTVTVQMLINGLIRSIKNSYS